MRAALAVAGCLVALAGALLSAQSSSLTDVGVSDSDLQNSVYQSVVGSFLTLPPSYDQIKTLQVARRAVVLLSAGSFAKTYLKSETFRQRYARDLSEGQLGRPTPAPARTFAARVQEETVSLERRLAEVRKTLPLLTTITRNQLTLQLQESERAGREQLRELAATSREDQRSWEREDRERFDHETADYAAAAAQGQALPVDPNALVQLRLRTFLAQTADVDFSAALTPQRRFVRPEYEAKPPIWKSCFRAGRLATEAARVFARGFLEEMGS